RALGVKSNRFAVISEGAIVVAFIRICVASANKSDNVFGIEFNRLVVIGDGFIVVAGIGICVALANRGNIARLRLGLSAFARLLLSPESRDWLLLRLLSFALGFRLSRRSCLALLLHCQLLFFRLLDFTVRFCRFRRSCPSLLRRCPSLFLRLLGCTDFRLGRRSCLPPRLLSLAVCFRLSRPALLLPLNIGLWDMSDEYGSTRAN